MTMKLVRMCRDLLTAQKELMRNSQRKEKRGCRISVYVTDKMNEDLKALSRMQNKNLTLTIADLLDEILKKEEYQKILKAYELAKEYMK